MEDNVFPLVRSPVQLHREQSLRSIARKQRVRRLELHWQEKERILRVSIFGLGYVGTVSAWVA